jgi:hypothetical protein
MRKPDPAFEIARELARQIDREIERQLATRDDETGHDIDAAMRRVFPMATSDDFKRARLILKERLDMLLEGTDDASLVERLRDTPRVSADVLFPKPDKSKS